MRTSTRLFGVLGAASVAAFAVVVAFGLTGPATQEGKLTAADAHSQDRLGWSVGLSGDTAVAGAMSANSGKGAAYVFTRTGTAWTPEATLSAADGAADDLFGAAVAVDGDTAVAGANYKSLQRGAAYVFTRTGTAWSEQAKLTATEAAPGDRFGIAVAVAGDTAVVGAFAANSFRGAAYVFTRTGTSWTQEARLTASDGANDDQFGYSVTVAGDTVVVGAPRQDTNRGAAYVFTRSGTSWTQQEKLTASDAGGGDQLGSSVAVAGDTVVAGAPTKSTLQGAAYVFRRTGTAWTQETKVTASDAASGDRFATSVGVSGDTAVVGADGKGGSGAGYVFARTGTAWSEKSRLEAADGASGDDLAYSVAVSGDTAVAGAWGKDGSKGAAYVFSPLSGGGAPAGYVLPTKVTLKLNAKHREKSTLTASGVFDTGGGAPDYASAATFDVGAFHLDVPAFVAKGRTLTFSAGWMSLTITRPKGDTSHALFAAKVTGDFTGAVDRDGPLVFRFKNAAHDLNGTVVLTKGVLGPHCVTAPDLCVRAAGATVKGGGKDALNLTLGFATGGVAPPSAPDLTIGFGGAYTSPVLSGASFVRRHNADVFSSKGPGITKATVDYAKGTITIAGARLDLGTFDPGANGVAVTVTIGGETRRARIRMSHTGVKLAY